MRAISIKQPWAWAILHAGKRIENRSREVPWSSAIGSVVLIHASAQQTRADYAQACVRIWQIARVTPPVQEAIDLGGIVGSCRIWRTRDYAGARRAFSDGDNVIDWATGPFCLLLDTVKALPFAPCKGHQGLWTVPPELVPPELRT